MNNWNVAFAYEHSVVYVTLIDSPLTDEQEIIDAAFASAQFDFPLPDYYHSVTIERLV